MDGRMKKKQSVFDKYNPPIKRPVGRPPTFSSPEELNELAERYFQEFEGTDKIPTFCGLAYAIGCHRDTLHEYDKKPEYSDILKRLKERVESIYESALINNIGNATGLIFALKNHYAWKDKHEHEYDISLTVSKMSDAEVNQRFKEIVERRARELAALPEVTE